MHMPIRLLRWFCSGAPAATLQRRTDTGGVLWFVESTTQGAPSNAWAALNGTIAEDACAYDCVRDISCTRMAFS